MSFIAKNPLSVPEIDYTPSTPKGTRGLFAKEDGWYDINNSGKITKVTCGVGEETNDGGEIFNDYENNKAISNKTTANGTNTIAGCKGFYWCDIDFSEEQPVITLTENRLSPPSSEISTGYAVGDVISIVNDAKYIDCATITAIGDNTITVDALPFTEVVDISSDLNFDDYTLCVLKKPTLGTVDLGIGANASGEGTKALGAYSNVKGKGNTGKGQYSDIGGRDNEGGYCAHIGGRENKGGSYDLIGGYKNNSDGGANVIGGVGNLNDGDNNIMGGRDNTNHGKNNVIGGAENLIKKGHHFIGMFGKGHISSALYQLFGGAWSKATTNTLFAIGNGSSDEERSNAFEVLKDGRAVLGAEPTSDMEAVNKSFLEKIINAINFKNGKGTGSICLPSTKSSKGAYTFTSGYENVNDEQNTIVGGRNNENYGKNNILCGAENTSKSGHHFSAIFGRGHISTALYQLFSGSWSNPSADTLLAVGNGTSDENRSNALEVHKDGRATLGAAPVNDMDAVNKKYVDGLKKEVESALNGKADESATLSGYGITDAYTKEEVDTIKDDLQLQVNSIYTTTLDDYYTKIETDRQMAEVESVAKGRATGYVFDTLEDLDIWLSDETNTANLVLGDNFYIRAVDVPDYWWDGSAKQQLETQKVDLTEYIKNTDYASDNIAGIVKVKTNTNSHGIKLNNDKILQVACAERTDIAAKASFARPIVPAHLEYAVEVCTNQDSNAELTEAQLKLPPSTQFMKDWIDRNDNLIKDWIDRNDNLIFDGVVSENDLDGLTADGIYKCTYSGETGILIVDEDAERIKQRIYTMYGIYERTYDPFGGGRLPEFETAYGTDAYTKEEVDALIDALSQKTQVQIITWEEND